MTKAEARRRRKRKRQIERAVAWVIFFAFEFLIALTPTAITAAILLPIAYDFRGYMAFGSEWLMIAIVFTAAYCVVHNYLCDKIWGEEV